jgi:hypothetical protein
MMWIETLTTHTQKKKRKNDIQLHLPLNKIRRAIFPSTACMYCTSGNKANYQYKDWQHMMSCERFNSTKTMALTTSAYSMSMFTSFSRDTSKTNTTLFLGQNGLPLGPIVFVLWIHQFNLWGDWNMLQTDNFGFNIQAQDSEQVM